MSLHIKWIGLKAFKKVIHPIKFRKRLDAEVTTAGRKIGLRLKREIRDRIRNKAYAANSAITEMMKGSSTPLVRHGDLLRSIGFSVRDKGRTIVVGVKRKRIRGRNIADVAAILHQGFATRFFGHGRLIYVKARPFLGEVIADDAFVARMEKIWSHHVWRALTARAG